MTAPVEALVDRRTPITVMIAVSVRLYREGLAATLNAHEHLRVEATAATPLEAQSAVRARQPDVAIVDVSLEDALSLTRVLRGESPRTRILALAVREDIGAVLDYAAAGADGFVTVNGSVPELVEAIERIAAGELLCSPRMAAQLLRQAVRRGARAEDVAMASILTGREQQVFSLLKQGLANKEIAVALHIAEATVKNHVHHVLEKMQVATRGQAVAAGVAPLKATLAPRSPSRRAS